MIYLSKSDKIGQDNAFFNESINDNFENTNKLLDIDSWFDEDDESSMIFISVHHLHSDFDLCHHQNDNPLLSILP